MTLRANAHGGEVYSVANQLHISVDDLLDFSSNANLFALPLTQQLVEKTPYPFLHYPDSKAQKLAHAIAEHEGVSLDSLLIGNGSTDLIWHTLQHLAPKKVLFIGPMFSEYAIACQSLHIPYSVLLTDEINHFNLTQEQHQQLWNTDADLVILCTPNNPACITYSPIHAILGMVRAPRILIDNTYREFLYGSIDYDQNHFNVYSRILRQGVALLTLNSFTKFFCCPGIRLGYIMSDRRHINMLSAQRPSWMVSPFAQIMGRTFLANLEAYRNTLPSLNEAVINTAQKLRQLDIVDNNFVLEGPGFVTFKVKAPWTSSYVYSQLLEKTILIRNCDSIPGMPQNYIRVQARIESDLQILLDALTAIAKKY